MKFSGNQREATPILRFAPETEDSIEFLHLPSSYFWLVFILVASLALSRR